MVKKQRVSQVPEKLLLLARQLLPEDPAYEVEVRLALEDCAGYVERFREQLQGRGITKPEPGLPWIALVDGLWSRKKLVEIDWREAPEEIIEQLDPLLDEYGSRPNRWEWADQEEDWDTEAFLLEIGRTIAADGLALACIDIESDSYPLLIVKSDTFDRARKLADESGYGKILPMMPE